MSLKKFIQRSFLVSLCFLLFFVSFARKISATDYDLSSSSNYDARIDGPTGESLTYQGGIITGDVNGDSIADLVVGAGLADNNGADSGSVYVIFGGSTLSGNLPLSTTSNFNIRYDGDAAGVQLGRYRQMAIGDVNGDGLGDLILGASTSDNGATVDTGAAWVIFSTLIDDVGATTGNTKSLATSTNYNIKYLGATANGYLTNAGVMGIGDINGDTKGDLILGASNEDNNGADSGSIYVMFSTLIDDVGSSTGNDKSLTTSTNYNIRFDGEAASNILGGNSVGSRLGIGDINGDSVSDLVMATEVSTVFVAFSTLIDDYSTTGNNLPFSTATSYNIRYSTTASTDQLGKAGSLAIGDVNGDSLGDLVLGAPLADTNLTNSGAVWVIYSTLIDDVGSSTGNGLPLTTTSNYIIQYSGVGSVTSSSQSRISEDGALAIGDVNGDNLRDLVIGASSGVYTDAVTGRGAAYVIFSTLIDDNTTTGNNKTLPNSSTSNSNYNIRYAGPNGSTRITDDGSMLIGDINGDGLGDLIIGTSGTIALSSQGGAYTFLSTLIDDVGSTTGNNYPLSTTSNYSDLYTGAASSDLLTAVRGIGVSDLNDDTVTDLLLSALGADTNGADSGAVYVFYATPPNTSPNTPSSLGGHVSGSFTNDTTPTLTFTLSDPDGADTVKYQIQIDDSSDFLSAVVDYTSALAAQGSTSFTVGQAAGSGTYTTGSAGQTLSDGNYYWKVKAIDNSSASSSFATANSGSIAFKVDATAPSTPGTPSATTPTTDTTPAWTWTASSDSGSGLASPAYTVQWCTDSGFSGCGSNTSTSSSTSFTHSTALTDGTWYFRVKASDSVGNDSSYSSNGSVVIDTTEPATPSIDSPGDNSYSNSQRPTFKWKASSDSGAGLSKYKLEVNNGDTGGGYTIDDIPTSRTTDYETNKYLIHYDNFSDSDSTNNYISVYTKSSSDWTSAENDGKLKEGKRTWSVVAVDSAGNQVSESKTLNVDLTVPSLDSLDIDGSTGEFNLSVVISDKKAGSNTSKSDYVRSNPDKIEVEIIKKTFLTTKTIATATINLSSICDYSDTSSDTLTCSFSKAIEADFGTGTFLLKVKGFDKAGNSVSTEAEESVGFISEPTPTPTPSPIPTGGLPPVEVVTNFIEGTTQTIVTTIQVISRALGQGITTTVEIVIERTQIALTAVIEAPVQIVSFTRNLIKSPALALKGSGQKVVNRFGFIIAAVFPGQRTVITGVKVEKITATSAEIVWETNHPATSKVNFGTDTLMEETAYDATPVKLHKLKIEDLPPGADIYFEVISEGRTTVYDSFRVFQTPQGED